MEELRVKLDKKEYLKNWRLNNKEKILEYQKKWKSDNIDYFKKYSIENKEKINLRTTEWNLNNKYKINEQNKNRRNNELIYKLTCYYRNRIKSAIIVNRWKKNNRHKELLGCDYKTIRMHFESKFTKGMNWENHGLWHIDHIIPCFTAKTENELINLFHYTNLQPLWAKDNIIKGKNIM